MTTGRATGRGNGQDIRQAVARRQGEGLRAGRGPPGVWLWPEAAGIAQAADRQTNAPERP